MKYGVWLSLRDFLVSLIRNRTANLFDEVRYFIFHFVFRFDNANSSLVLPLEW